MSLESNLRKSFREVRKDILEIKNQILRLAENQEKLEAVLVKKATPKKKTSKKVSKKTSKKRK